MKTMTAIPLVFFFVLFTLTGSTAKAFDPEQQLTALLSNWSHSYTNSFLPSLLSVNENDSSTKRSFRFPDMSFRRQELSLSSKGTQCMSIYPLYRPAVMTKEYELIKVILATYCASMPMDKDKSCQGYDQHLACKYFRHLKTDDIGLMTEAQTVSLPSDEHLMYWMDSKTVLVSFRMSLSEAPSQHQSEDWNWSQSYFKRVLLLLQEHRRAYEQPADQDSGTFPFVYTHPQLYFVGYGRGGRTALWTGLQVLAYFGLNNDQNTVLFFLVHAPPIISGSTSTHWLDTVKAIKRDNLMQWFKSETPQADLERMWMGIPLPMYQKGINDTVVELKEHPEIVPNHVAEYPSNPYYKHFMRTNRHDGNAIKGWFNDHQRMIKDLDFEPTDTICRLPSAHAHVLLHFALGEPLSKEQVTQCSTLFKALKQESLNLDAFYLLARKAFERAIEEHLKTEAAQWALKLQTLLRTKFDHACSDLKIECRSEGTTGVSTEYDLPQQDKQYDYGGRISMARCDYSTHGPKGPIQWSQLYYGSRLGLDQNPRLGQLPKQRTRASSDFALCLKDLILQHDDENLSMLLFCSSERLQAGVPEQTIAIDNVPSRFFEHLPATFHTLPASSILADLEASFDHATLYAVFGVNKSKPCPASCKQFFKPLSIEEQQTFSNRSALVASVSSTPSVKADYGWLLRMTKQAVRRLSEDDTSFQLTSFGLSYSYSLEMKSNMSKERQKNFLTSLSADLGTADDGKSIGSGTRVDLRVPMNRALLLPVRLLQNAPRLDPGKFAHCLLMEGPGLTKDLLVCLVPNLETDSEIEYFSKSLVGDGGTEVSKATEYMVIRAERHKAWIKGMVPPLTLYLFYASS